MKEVKPFKPTYPMLINVHRHHSELINRVYGFAELYGFDAIEPTCQNYGNIDHAFRYLEKKLNEKEDIKNFKEFQKFVEIENISGEYHPISMFCEMIIKEYFGIDKADYESIYDYFSVVKLEIKNQIYQKENKNIGEQYE